MRHYRFKAAYLADGWSQDAVVSVSDDGFIMNIQPGADRRDGVRDAAREAAHDAEAVGGIAVPGMPNAHSHAFQRAMAGDTEYRVSSRDSFWTWRQSMYSLANRLEPEQLELIATQLYVEMLKAGYTSVAEFHYLHRQRDGRAYSGSNPLWEAVQSAASTAGIGLTFLPTLYQSSDFGALPLKPEQSRFAFDTETFVHAVESQLRADRTAAPPRRTGVAFHSLRAVPLAELQRAAAALRALDAGLPLHIHIAEQRLEVESCLRQTAMRPIELLMETGLVDDRWCLVHATHANPKEIKSIARSGAAVCLSISTEANLGDGCFDAVRFLRNDGRLCVGSDSQSTVSPAEELRWLEYQQRLRKGRRGVLADDAEPHVGSVLWRGAARAGAQALGQPAGSIEVGRRADWLVLDPAHPSLAGGAVDTILDRLLFAGGEKAIRDVMVAGRWVIKDGAHAADESLRRRLGPVLADLGKR
jgi:formimidoylglutamate deiminase